MRYHDIFDHFDYCDDIVEMTIVTVSQNINMSSVKT